MRDSELIVGISGLDSGTNPHPGTAVAMALKRDPEFKGKIIGLSYDPMVSGAFMDELFDDFALVPWPGDHEAWYVRSLTEIHRDLGLNVLLPCLDSDLPTVARLQDTLRSQGIGTLAPDENAVKSRFKSNLAELARNADVKTPRTGVLYDTGQLHPLDGWAWPLYIKGALADAEVAYNEEEASYLFRKMAKKWGYPVMAQESRAGVEYLVAGVIGRQGDLLGSVAVKKGATTSSGKATSGVTVQNAELSRVASRVLSALDWRGPFELEFMKDATTDDFLLIEVNGRFPAWISFATEIGSPLVRIAVQEAAGMKPKRIKDPEDGVHFSRAHVQCWGETTDLGIWKALARSEASARRDCAMTGQRNPERDK